MELNKGKILTAQLIRDPMDKRLYQKCKKVTNPRSEETFWIIDRMKHICKAVNGVGLAANQIGINRQIMVCLNEQTGELLEFINLRYTDGTPMEDWNIQWDKEGCLSHPGIIAEVARYKAIEFIAQRMKNTKEQTFRAEGMLARIIQHEYDHTVRGKIITDLGAEVRNIVFDTPGQQILMEATRKSFEDGPKEWTIE